MLIVLNGEPREIAPDSTLAELLDALELSSRRFAVEINEALVPRSQHATHRLRADDQVEIVQAIGGG